MADWTIMAYYRFMKASLECDKCQQTFEDDVQFKTGKPSDNLQCYTPGQDVSLDSDLVPGESYTASAQWYCKVCKDKRKVEEVRAFYLVLADLIDAEKLDLKQRGWFGWKDFSPDTLRKEGEKQYEKLLQKQTAPNKVFEYLNDVEITWNGQPAIPGNTVHNNFLDTINDKMFERFQTQGWSQRKAIRSNLQIVIDSRHHIHLVDMTPSTVEPGHH